MTKRSSRPTTPILSRKKALTKDDYKELIEMHSRNLKETHSAPSLTFVDLTEEDLPSFQKVMTVRDQFKETPDNLTSDLESLESFVEEI